MNIWLTGQFSTLKLRVIENDITLNVIVTANRKRWTVRSLRKLWDWQTYKAISEPVAVHFPSTCPFLLPEKSPVMLQYHWRHELNGGLFSLNICNDQPEPTSKACLSPKVWFKNRRAKFRKKQRSLQKEQLQKQKEVTEGALEEVKGEPPAAGTSDAHTPPSSTSSPSEAEGPPHPLPAELSVEVNVTSAEQSGSESAAEDNTDKEEEPKGDKGLLPGHKSPPCKRLSPKAGREAPHPHHITSLRMIHKSQISVALPS